MPIANNCQVFSCQTLIMQTIVIGVYVSKGHSMLNLSGAFITLRSIALRVHSALQALLSLRTVIASETETFLGGLCWLFDDSYTDFSVNFGHDWPTLTACKSFLFGHRCQSYDVICMVQSAFSLFSVLSWNLRDIPFPYGFTAFVL